MLNSKAVRAKYVETVLADPQRPFVWEYFRPGTIPLAGECAFYDEVSLFSSSNNGTDEPHVETSGSLSV